MKDVNDCPFCGGSVYDRKMYGNITGFQCTQCNAIVSFIGKESRTEAVIAFNSRV